MIFDPLSAGALLIMAANQPDICPAPPPAKINVRPRTKDIVYDTGRTMAQIQGTKIDTIDPYGFHGVTMTQGFMEGQIKMEPTVELDYKYIPQYQAMCIWYKSIDIEIEIDPKIVLAKEVAADRCMKAAVLEHEMKHVKADRQIVNKYAKSMGTEVYNALAQRGFKVGPIRAEHGQETADKMHKVVYQILEHEYKKMDLERTEVQRAVDNLQEYERVNALCPNFKLKTENLKAKKR